MSLNGLDSGAVVQAHQDALAEAGGWFLLKYATRDTVELLGNGHGGIAEARSTIQDYEEKSPLYGLLHYRRKKIILKYVPDGTSRLLQVRLAVHFQSVLDAFAPHDTVFAFTESSELSESAMGLTAMLPASHAETSSISSVRLQRLNEIDEDSEEATAHVQQFKTSDPAAESTSVGMSREEIGLNELPASAQRAKALLSKRRQESADHMSISQRSMQSITISPAQDDLVEKKVFLPDSVISPTTAAEPASQVTPTIPLTESARNFAATEREALLSTERFDNQSNTDVRRPSLPRPSFDITLPDIDSDSDDDLRRPTPKPVVEAPRHSTHLTAAESSSISRWTEDVVASTRTKDRKQSSDSSTRPKTSGTSDSIPSSTSRKVANMPASMRATSKRISTSQYRPSSQQSTRSMPTRWAPSPNLPPPIPSPTFPSFPIADRQIVAPRKDSSRSTITIEPPTVTPEKMRLMKALQMRKRNQLLAARSTATSPSTPIDDPAGFNSFSSAASHASTQLTDISPVVKEPPDPAESDVTSPTTHLAASDSQSTKPSSVSGGSRKHASSTSLSSDTNSSTTPRAGEKESTMALSSEQQAIAAPSAEHKKVDMIPALSATITTLEDMPAMDTPHIPVSASFSATEESIASVTQPDGGSEPEQTSNNGKRRSRFDGKISIPPQGVDLSDISDDDDSFMDELQHATVEEARPIAVSRNQKPITPVQSRAPLQLHDPMPSGITLSKQRKGSSQSASSTPDRQGIGSRAGSTRSSSTALPQWPPQASEPVPSLPKQKPALGAVISKRIKTFEGLSNRDSIGLLMRSNTDVASKAPGSTSMPKRTSFLRYASEERLREHSPSTEPATPAKTEYDMNEEKVTAAPWLQRPGTSAEAYPQIRKGESVSITAHIVRKEAKSSHGTADTTGMFRSPLVVAHGVSTSTNGQAMPVLPPPTTTGASRSTSPVSDRRRFSFSSFRGSTALQSPSDTKSQRMSMAVGSRNGFAPSASETSSVADEKRTSRTSRMLKRLSGLGKSRGKDSGSTPPATPETAHPDTIQESEEVTMRHVVDIGEVNVQFADSMLWKRRFLRVDDHGFLIFAPPVNEPNKTGKSRKIHLDELQKPSLPDREREEMAWSIILDLRSGGTVQCACESRAAQISVLKMLIDAHGAYHQLYCG